MGRSPCCDKSGLKKGPWTSDEDLKLTQYIQLHGPGNWRALPNNAGLERCGKSCRLRWTNYLRPDIKRGRFSFEEEETIIQLHSVLGNKWSAIAARLPGRTDNEIKNYWNTHIRKRLLKMGIDPVTHAPRLDLLDLSSILNSPQLNLSNLLGLAMSLVSSHNNENQMLLNSHFQGQVPIVQPNQFENIINQQNLTTTSSFDNNNQSQLVQLGDMGHSHVGSTNSNGHIFQDNLMPNINTNDQIVPIENFPSFSNCDQKQMGAELSDNSSFQSFNTSSSQNLGFDSVLSTHELSSATAQMSSGSGFINGSTDDESFCSNLLRFEIPEGLSFEEFM
ncbi:hypothetical protein CASFOL_008124 [Castilleja foliolosa]|uniref:Uncharacterized protein n=1 Tax=Castilleja foliolosa TaxID=1961234 RepID=A0ABD3E233_9LAMI